MHQGKLNLVRILLGNCLSNFPFDVEDIEAFVAELNPDLVPYLHPASEESNNRYALTAFSPVNNLPVDISEDENGTLSTDGFNGYESINPNNQLLLEQPQSNVVEAKLLSAASGVKQLPPAEGDDELSKSSAIVLANNNNTGALGIIPESVSTLDVLETDEEVLSLTLTNNPVEVLSAIIIEDNLEQRNKNGYITKSTGEEVFHSSCKNLAAGVIRNTEKIKPLFFGQLVEGDRSYYDHVNKITRVFIDETGQTVTYEGLVKLAKFASEWEIAVDEDKVLEATIKNAANAIQITEYDGPSLQSLKNDYQLTVPIAKDIIRTYWNLDTIENLCSNNTVLSKEDYETYRKSRNYDAQSNVMRESDLPFVSDSSRQSLKNFLEYAANNSSSESVAIKELETLLSEISQEQAEILNTPPEEIPDLISAITLKSNEVEDINSEITNIVTNILQKHFQCDLDKAQEMLALYPAIETVLEIGTEEDESGNDFFNLPSDIWTNKDYCYEEWNGQRDLLPFPSKQEYKKFVGFIKNIKGNDKDFKWDSILLMMDLENTLDLLNSNDLEAARELKTKIDEETKAKAQREIEEESEEAIIEELSSHPQELPTVDIHANNDSKNDAETELNDSGFVDPAINISSKDLSIIEDILQSKLSNKRLSLRHQMVWKKFFDSLPYEEVSAEIIDNQIDQARKMLHRS